MVNLLFSSWSLWDGMVDGMAGDCSCLFGTSKAQLIKDFYIFLCWHGQEPQLHMHKGGGHRHATNRNSTPVAKTGPLRLSLGSVPCKGLSEGTFVAYNIKLVIGNAISVNISSCIILKTEFEIDSWGWTVVWLRVYAVHHINSL